MKSAEHNNSFPTWTFMCLGIPVYIQLRYSVYQVYVNISYSSQVPISRYHTEFTYPKFQKNSTQAADNLQIQAPDDLQTQAPDDLQTQAPDDLQTQAPDDA